MELPLDGTTQYGNALYIREQSPVFSLLKASEWVDTQHLPLGLGRICSMVNGTFLYTLVRFSIVIQKHVSVSAIGLYSKSHNIVLRNRRGFSSKKALGTDATLASWLFNKDRLIRCA